MGTSAVGEMNIILSANAASFSAGIDQAQRQLNKLAGTSKTTSRTMVSDLQATSGGLRLLEGGMTNSLRAAERFLATIPGVGAAMKAAFPLVGAIAFSAILVRLGKEVYDFIETTNKVPQALKQGFDELGLSSRTANDELEKTDIDLQNQIAKLENKPQNHLSEALVDARLAADKLAESLAKDNREVTDLLSRQKISLVAGLVTGKESTSKLSGTVNSYNAQMEDLANQRSIALDQGNTALAADLAKQLKDKQAAALAAMSKAVADAMSEQATVTARGAGAIGMQRNGNLSLALDPSANLYIAHGEQAEILSRQQSETDEDQVAKDTATEKKLQAAKDFAEEQKRLQGEEVKQWRQQLDDLKAAQDTTVLQEAQFWLQRAETVKQGSLAYRAAMDEADKSIATMRQQNVKAAQELAALGGAPVESTDTAAQAEARTHAEAYLRNVGDVADTPALQEQGKQAVEYLKNLDEGIALEKRNAAALAEDSLAMAVATGQITRLDAAQAQAALHAKEYADAIAGIDRAEANVASNPALTPLEREGQLSALGNQRTQVQGQRDVQVLQDQQEISDQTFGGASKEALDRMVADWEDMATKVASTLVQTIGSFNDDIAKLLVGEGGHNRQQIGAMFGRTFRSAGEGLIHTGLQGAEASVLGKFGLGGGKKPTGTQGDPLYTVVTNLGGGGGGGNPVSAVAGALTSRIPGAAPAAAVAENLFGGSRQGAGLIPMPQFPSLPAAALPNVTGLASMFPDIANLVSSPLFPSLPATASPNVIGPAASSTLNVPAAPSVAVARSLTGILGGALTPRAGAQSGISALPSEDADGTDGAGTNGVGNANKAYTMVTKPGPSLLDSILGDTIQQAGKIGGSMLVQGAFAGGGQVFGPGSGTSDSIPAMVSHGEFITNARSTAKHLPLLHAINSDALHFVDGGLVGSDILDNYPSLVSDTHLGGRASAAPQMMPGPTSVGGDTYHSYTIDARGATDPAQTQAAVQRAMRQYGPQMVSASLAAAKNQQMRKPSTAR